MSISFHQDCMCPQRVCPTAELKLFFVPFLKSFEHNCFIFFLSQSLIFYHILIFIQAKAFALEVIGSHESGMFWRLQQLKYPEQLVLNFLLGFRNGILQISTPTKNTTHQSPPFSMGVTKGKDNRVR